MAQLTITVPEIKCGACGQMKTATATGFHRDMSAIYDPPEGWHRFRLESDRARAVFLCGKCATSPIVYINREV